MTDTESRPDDWITTREAAKLTGYTLVHVRRLVKDDKVKGKRFGQVWQVSRSSMLKYAKETEQKGPKRGPKSKDSRSGV